MADDAPQCTAGHGPLIAMDGWYSLRHHRWKPGPSVFSPEGRGEFQPTGNWLFLRVYRCTHCTRIELRDEEVD